LKTLRNELVSAKEEAVRAQLEAAELKRVAVNLRLELKEAERELQRLNAATDQAKAEASAREKQIAMLSQRMANCDEFFEEWDEVKASPPSILAIFRVTREAAAAKDCLEKGDVATACQHWRALLAKIEKMGSPVRESRVEIEELMRQNHCQKYASSAPLRRFASVVSIFPAEDW
jgi:hypothetical protein